VARAVDLTNNILENTTAKITSIAELSLELRAKEEEARRLAEYPTDQLAWQNAESFSRGTREEYGEAAAELGRLQRLLNMPDVFIGRDGRVVEDKEVIAKRYAMKNGIPPNTPFVLPMLLFKPSTGNWLIGKEQTLVESYE
jgi:hypothetical protein